MIFSEQNNEVAAAIVACWNLVDTDIESRDVTITSKKGEGRSYSFSYIDLNSIIKVVRNVFSEHGLALMQDVYTENSDAGFTYVAVQTTLLHASGQWAKTHPLKLPVSKTMYELGGQNLISSNMQDFGSQTSYLKRYSLYAALGITIDRGDDAPPQQRRSQKVPTTLEEAEKVVVGFGRSKGKTLKDIWFNDFSSIEWLEQNARDEDIKAGIRIMRDVAKQQSEPQPFQQPIPKTSEEAGAVVLRGGGKHDGRTLSYIYKNDYPYFETLRESVEDPLYVTAIQLMDLAVKAALQKKKEQQQQHVG